MCYQRTPKLTILAFLFNIIRFKINRCVSKAHHQRANHRARLESSDHQGAILSFLYKFDYRLAEYLRP